MGLFNSFNQLILKLSIEIELIDSTQPTNIISSTMESRKLQTLSPSHSSMLFN